MSKTDSQLGKPTEYPQTYSKEVLLAIPRAESREPMLNDAALPFHGVDFWNAWDLTWLAKGGQPQIATAAITIKAESRALVESKSLKLYLGSFAMTEFASPQTVATTVRKDLSALLAGDVTVDVSSIPEEEVSVRPLSGNVIDHLAVDCDTWHVDPTLLAVSTQESVQETLLSHTLRSLCPVTAQPDLGSVQIRYFGPKIDPHSLLRYIASFRLHDDFHEACVERMFIDLKRECRCEKLSVYARYQRRGGIDINPFRSDFEDRPGNARMWRQ